MRSIPTRPRALLAVGLVAFGVALGGCGSAGRSSTSARRSGAMDGMAMGASRSTGVGGRAQVRANATDRAFVRQMIPHHEMAVVMSETARERAEHPQLRALARTIVAAQEREIGEMSRIASGLGVTPDQMPADGAMGSHMMGDDATLGLSMSQSGMSMRMSSLASARPFDRAFLQMMVPHHQGAVNMARSELRHGVDPQLRALATRIVSSQSAQISEMDRWLRAWY